MSLIGNAINMSWDRGGDYPWWNSELNDSKRYFNTHGARLGGALGIGMLSAQMSGGGAGTAFLGGGLAYLGGTAASSIGGSMYDSLTRNMAQRVHPIERSSFKNMGMEAARYLTHPGGRGMLFAGGALLTGLSFGMMRANNRSLATGINANRGSRPIG